MNPEILIGSLLGSTAIKALVSARVALGQLPDNTTYPAIVYQVVDAYPEPNVNFDGSQRARARIQINPIAATLAKVKAIHAAIRSELDFLHQETVLTKLIISCRFASLGPADRDTDAGLWTQPADYILQWYE
ncbi:MAG: DUF3168 domain-containing protein [Phycisphaerales bacterium]|nr:DUF3168 domain-containing protein [Phycisphaerales bacterium]